MSGIRLSKKYGVNPTICKCFFCGKDKYLALLGHLGGHGQDLEAPMSCVMDYEPCDECQKQMNQGVALIEAVDKPPVPSMPSVKVEGGKELYPAGRMLVVKAEAWSRITQREFSAGDKCFVDPEVIDGLLQTSKEDNDEEMSSIQ